MDERFFETYIQESDPGSVLNFFKQTDYVRSLPGTIQLEKHAPRSAGADQESGWRGAGHCNL